MSKKHAKIVGVGRYLPEKILDNAYFEGIVETSDEWILQRVGIKERRMSDENTFASDLAAKAAENALKDAGMDASEIDLIVMASVSPEMYTPSGACIVQSKIGAKNAAAFDVNAACPGFIFAITVATQFVENGVYKNVLVIGADTLTKITEYKDRSTCVLCGLKVSELDKERRPFGNYRTIWMDGQLVYKFAVKTMVSSTIEVVENAGYTIDDIDLVIPHQANQRIIQSARKRLGLDESRVFSNVEQFGNMSAACIPVALCQAIEEGRIKKGQKLVIVSMGGGLTWGSVLIEL